MQLSNKFNGRSGTLHGHAGLCRVLVPQRLSSRRAAAQPSNSRHGEGYGVKAHAAATEPAETSKEKYDVYVADVRPLSEGEEKHVISVFVADESGLINRVAGVFARRGANIESLAVGLNVDKALFTIVVAGTDGVASNLVKQLGKLVKVRYVEDITRATRVDRELMLVKVAAPSGDARREVLQLSQIFRAHTVDVSDATVTLCASGDPGKIVAMQRVLSRFGILQVARTGRISLKRGQALLEPQQFSGMAGEVAAPSATPPQAFISMDADVYQVDKDAKPGVWQVQNIIEPREYVRDKGETASGQEADAFGAHTLSITVADIPGVLQEVTGLFSRRGYNVQSLAVGPSEVPGDSRITMVIPGTDGSIATIIKNVVKLVNVRDIVDLTIKPYVTRELMLVKVRCSPSKRSELRDLAEIFRASVIDMGPSTASLEVTGREDKMRAMVDLLEPYGVLEIARTGRVALSRESGVDTKYLETLQNAAKLR